MRDRLALMRHEAKTKPHIQALIDRAVTLTDEEIKTTPNLMQWHRDALVELRKKGYDAEMQKKIDAYYAGMNHIQGEVKDPMGAVAYFDRMGSEWIQVSASSSIEVKEGYPIFFPDDGGVWIDTVFIERVPASLAHLAGAQRMTKLEYKALLRERRNGLL